MRRSYPRNYVTKQTPLGKLLKDARLRSRISQAQLAETIGISRPFLSQLESGRYLQPAPGVLQRIAEVLDVSLDDLHALTGYTAPSGLPDYRAYLHAKYSLPEQAIDELSDYFEFIRTKYADRKRPHEDNLTSETSGHSPAT